MTAPALSPEDVPSWATPEAWDHSERIVDKAEAIYRELARNLKLEENAFGKFIIVSSENREQYVIGDTEAEADRKWQARNGDIEHSALFQIGNI